ncbi:2-hydroxy-3-oxopropionate reductase [Micromonospora sp. NPDC049559]|uniref:2-hydroxy-3-oxopropionate reductase n=1 Tax=Micromonospora sp. NPDC049559 TaxID=3155923 RepID=UPI0034354072
MTSIGFIGLGIMGAPMAANLIKAGYEVIGYDRSQPRLEQLRQQGGRTSTGVPELVRVVDVVITMVPDSPDVEDVAFGPDGILANAKSGQLYIDTSSISPKTAQNVATAAREYGVRVLDAPVSGGEQGAIDGNLSIMVGGEEADFAAAREILEVVGSTVVHVGPHGAGQTVKVANQLIVAGTIELVAEAIVFLEAYGVDTAAAVKVLAGGLAGNRILDRKAAGMLAREFQPGFRVELHHKDLGNLQAAAREVGVVIPLGAVVSQLMAALKAQGDGGLDHTALLKLVEQLSGRASR